ncbi:acyltransferase [Acuticoccus sp. I52.16.1]|uniref:acyltransferase family protein n=1 Tax=Acuticoccus sp. I52.16.1 TaxID=2928472 RepID=UPI001FD12CBA|nr:acyltransferase [Acuticoccus sp. I52.16.1]UOM34203.1 acyltransferase [Acuticoccus sp. I52.16.1]
MAGATLAETPLGAGVIPARAGFGYIPGLDGIRAFSVLLVIVAHMGAGDRIPGGFGVTVFFFISGFLITRLLLAERAATQRIHLWRFYVRRFLRLMPAMWLMLAGSAIVYALVLSTYPRWIDVFAAVTYWQNYLNIYYQAHHIPENLNWGHLWSLAVEEHFYLIFPAMLAAFGFDLRRFIIGCLVVCGLSLLWRLTTFYILDFFPKWNYYTTDARIESILWGCLLSLILFVSPERLRRLIGALPVALALAVLLVGFLYRDEGFRETLRYTLQGGALFVLFLNLFFWPRLRFAVSILEISVLAWLGRISYGLYLWHWPAIDVVEKLGHQPGEPAHIIGSIVLTLVPTVLSFYFVEKPILRLRRHFGSHATRTAPPTPSTTPAT